MTNRLKGSDLIDRVPEKLWTEVYDIVQEAGIKTIPKKKKCKKTKYCLRRAYKKLRKKRSERQRRKEKIFPINCSVPKNSKEREESLPHRNAKK